MAILSAEYLHNTRDNHDKVYNVQLEENGDRYTVVAEYGRRTGVLKRITKYSGNSRFTALIQLSDLVNEKLSKGYTRVGRGNAGTTAIGTTSQKPKKTKSDSKPDSTPLTKPKEPDTYNPNFIPERRFDDL